MAAKTDPAKIDDAIRRYLTDEPVQEILSDLGISTTLFCRVRKARGIPARRLDLPREEIVSAYLAGGSEYGLSRQFGIARGTIARVLTEAGVERRDISQAGLVRAAAMSPAERRSQTAAANRATRMRRIPEIEKYRRALTTERQGRPGSPGERVLYDLLVERGEHPQVERAIGPYNVDLAVLPVAVEVLGGRYHGVKARHAERSPYILDAGWNLVMVWDDKSSSPVGPGAAEYIVAFAEQVRRNPPAMCQYRVIAGDGEELAARSREDNEFPLVPPSRRRKR